MADDQPTVSSYSSIFGGDTGLAYQELVRQRALAQLREGKERPFPKNVGEGIFSAAQSVADALDAKRVQQMQARQQGAERRLIGTDPPLTHSLNATGGALGVPGGGALPLPPAGTTVPMRGGNMTVTPPVPGSGTALPPRQAVTSALMDQYDDNPYAGFGLG